MFLSLKIASTHKAPRVLDLPGCACFVSAGSTCIESLLSAQMPRRASGSGVSSRRLLAPRRLSRALLS